MPSSRALLAMTAVLTCGIALPAIPVLAACADTMLTLSDSELLAYARSSFGNSPDSGGVIVGRYQGTVVVAGYACSDVCPDYTVRIIHYDVSANREECTRVGGIVRTELVPIMMGNMPVPFCEPKILAELGIG